MITLAAFYDPRNHPPKRPHDGDEFRDFACRFAASHNAFPTQSASDIRAVVSASVRHGQMIDQIGFFCHGWPNRLSLWSPTPTASTNARQLADLIRPILKPMGNIGLFACRTAENAKDGTVGFAAALSAALPGITVMAHDFPAHTVRNPHDVLFLDGKRIYSYPDPRNYPCDAVDLLGKGGADLVSRGWVVPHLRDGDNVQIGWMHKLMAGIPSLDRWIKDYGHWCDWERSDKGGQRGLSLVTIDGWQAAEAATGLKLSL